MENNNREHELEDYQQVIARYYDDDQRSPLTSAVLIILGLLGLFILACSICLP